MSAVIAKLRVVLRRLSALAREGSAVVNLLENGADLLLRLDGVPNLADRTRLAAFAGEFFARFGAKVMDESGVRGHGIVASADLP